MISTCNKTFTIPAGAIQYPLRIYNNGPDPQEIFWYANQGPYDVFTLLNAGIFWLQLPAVAGGYVVDISLTLTWAGVDVGLIDASADAMFVGDLGSVINTSPLNLLILGLVVPPATVVNVGIESGATVSGGPWMMDVVLTVL